MISDELAQKYDLAPCKCEQVLKSLIAKGTKVGNINYKNYDTVISSNLLSEDELTLIAIDSTSYHAYLGSTYRKWYATDTIRRSLLLHPTRCGQLLEDSTVSDVKLLILAGGFYNNISIFDKLADDSLPDVALSAIKFCSVSKAREKVKHSDYKIRKAVFKRLGPVECLDDMLTDKSAAIRAEGVRLAPAGYDKLSKMTGEISRQVFEELVKKIHIDALPMLLGNRNIDKKRVQSVIDRRLQGE